MNIDRWKELYNDPFFNKDVKILNFKKRPIKLRKFNLVKGIPKPDSNLVDLEKYHRTQELDKYKENPSFEKINKQINPWLSINQAHFIDRGGIQMANIESVFSFDPLKVPIVYTTIGDNNTNGINQYMQWRYPTSFGYSVTLSPELGGEEVDRKYLTYNNHAMTYCDDGSGDVVYNVEWIRTWILARAKISGNIPPEKLKALGLGVDLFIGTSNTIMAEVAEILLALEIMWEGATMVIKSCHTNTKLIADIIYSLQECFDYITLFKAVTLDMTSSEIYIICKNYYGKDSASKLIGALKEINRLNVLGKGIKEFIPKLPESFEKELKNFNDKLCDAQILINTPIVEIMTAAMNINNLNVLDTKIENIIEQNIPQIDLSEMNSYWDLGTS